MRRLRLPAVLTVTVVGVVAPLATAVSACSGDDGPTHPDAPIAAHVDARTPGDGSAPSDAGTVDAVVPMDAPPDTAIT